MSVFDGINKQMYFWSKVKIIHFIRWKKTSTTFQQPISHTVQCYLFSMNTATIKSMDDLAFFSLRKNSNNYKKEEENNNINYKTK